jgi:hypothetical protein
MTRSAKLSRWHRAGVSVTTLALWGTGVVILWAHVFGKKAGPFGPEPHWVEFPARAAHGLAAPVFLMVLGSLAPRHVPSGWQTGTRRGSAVTLGTAALILILTGWGLYYAGGDTLRQGIRWTHSALGMLLLPFFLFHSKKKPF